MAAAGDIRIQELTGELWIVTHADLRRTARVRAFFDIVGEGLVSQRGLLAGDTTKSIHAAPATA